MKTVQQIMQETGAEANIRNFRYMQENYTYKQKIRHAENVARSYQDKCSEMGLNCHISVGGLDSITLHYFLEACGVHVPCVSCSSLEQKGVQAVRCAVSASSWNSAQTGLIACAAQTPKNGNSGCAMFVVTIMVTGMDGAAYSTTSAWNGKTNPASYPVKCLLRITKREQQQETPLRQCVPPL